jgi:enamine deaminase RidA (YjgF/YER057c/UK114 family)
MSIQRTGGGPYAFSQVVVHGGVVHLAGQVAGIGQPVREQIKLVFAQVDELLAGAGTDRSHLLTATVLLADIDDFGVLNEEWDAWIDHANLPTRATFQAALANPEIRFEMVVSAALPSSG